jgi:enoyl-CoA hydratase/carnithine racemase
MSIVLWEKKDTVAVLTMNNKENRMNLDYASAMIQALDEILEDKGVF